MSDEEKPWDDVEAVLGNINESEPAPLPVGVASMAEMPLRWSKRRDKLAAALAAAQGEITLAGKDRTNEHLGSSYASLGGIREVGRIPLSKHGIALVQGPRVVDKTVTVVTQLVHSSGQWVECELTFVADYMKGLNWMQVFGNVIAYARRYTLTAITGVAVQEDEHDDDGQGLADDRQRGGGPDREQRQRPAAPKVEMPQSIPDLRKAIAGLKSLAESAELWRMKRFFKFEIPPDEQKEIDATWGKIHDDLRKAEAAGGTPKAAEVAKEIKERKAAAEPAPPVDEKMRDGSPPTFDCAFCGAEIRVGGLYIDKEWKPSKAGPPACSACIAKGK